MPTWNSRGLRGSTLEDMLNRTNEKYLANGLALIQKIPTPITPINIDKESRHITLAYFDQKSTVDYIGAVQGIPVCFDAKECNTDTFPLANIHEHQVLFMEQFDCVYASGSVLLLKICGTETFLGACRKRGTQKLPDRGIGRRLFSSGSIRCAGTLPEPVTEGSCIEGLTTHAFSNIIALFLYATKLSR